MTSTTTETTTIETALRNRERAARILATMVPGTTLHAIWAEEVARWDAAARR